MIVRWNRGAVAGTFSLAFLCSTTALAQVPAPVPPAEGQAQAEDAESPGEEIIVTAQRREEVLERTPVSVAVLGAEDLSEQVVLSEADLQTTVPGLTVKAGQTNNQLNYSLRGQTVDAFSSSRPSVLPYINEVQVGGASASAFYDLQSVQVLKGPQGTLFGRNSTGGAVLFTTATPTDQLGGFATVRVGNYDLVQAEGAINLPLAGESVALRLAGFFQRRDGYQFNLFDQDTVGDVRREAARVSLAFKPGLGVRNDLVVDYLHSGGSNLSSVVYNVLPLGQGAPFVPNNFLYSPAVDAAFGPGTFARFLAAHPGADPQGIIEFAKKQQARGPYVIDVDSPNFHRSERLFISNVTRFEVGPNTEIKNILGYVDREGNDTSEFDGTPFPANSNGLEGRGGTLRQFSEEFQVLGKAFGERLSYVAGLYYAQERDETRSLTVLLDLLPLAPPIRQVNNGLSKSKTYAVYSQGTFDLSDSTGVQGLSVTGGLRYSIEKAFFRHQKDDVYLQDPNPAFVNPLSDTFKKLSWTLGVQNQVNERLLIYAASRRSHRSGGFNFFAPPLPGFGNDGGSEYKAETATDIEVGTKYRGRLGSVPVRFSLAGYNMWVDDIQRSTYVSIFGSLAGITVNVPKAEITGFEFDADMSPTNWLNVGGSINYTDARFTSNIVSVIGNPSVAFGPYPDTPKWSGVAYAEASVPMSARLQANIRGDVYTQTSSFFSSTANTLNPGTKIPGYALANFRLGLQDKDAGWSIAAVLKNAFDKTYYAGGIGFSSLLALNTVIPGEPRTFLVETRLAF